MKKTLQVLFATTAIWLSAASLVSAQQYPFPQNITYSYGKKPQNASHADALAAYNSWKSEYVTSATCAGTGGLRVKFDSPQSNNTVSEGIGYGMLLAAYAGDQTTFDGLWQFYQANTNGNGIMNWKVNSSCGTVGGNGATDAELDVAMALYVADWQWNGQGYMADCQSMVDLIRTKEVDAGSSGHGRYTLRPGDQFGGHGSGSCGDGSCDDFTNPSYFSPAYYRVFANYVDQTNATFWNKLADDGYDLIDLAMNSTTGLVPDWCKGSDGAVNPGFAASQGYNYNGERFFFDAIRTPLRSALDYLWWGNADALAYCEKVNDWVISENGSAGTSNMGSGYYLNGTEFDNSHSNTFVGCFGVSAMATDNIASNYQTHVDNAYTDNKNTPPPSGQYFNSTLKTITLFIQTGNFYLPPPDQCTSPDLGADVSLCTTSPQVLNSNLSATGRTFVWKRNGVTIGGATGATYSATQAGIYEVTSTESGCVRRDDIEVFAVTPTADFTYNLLGTTVELNNNSTNGVTIWSWDVDDGGSTVDYTTEDATHPYSSAGVYDVTLTVENTCGNTNSITKQIAIGNPGSATGFVSNDIENWPYSVSWGGANIAVTNNCSEIIATCTNPGQYTPFGVTFLDGTAGTESTEDVEDYPYVIMRIKTSAPIELRADLGDDNTNCGGTGNPCSTSQTPTFIDLTSNVGQYQIVTLDYTGKFFNYTGDPVDDNNIKQISFTPGDGPLGAQSFTGTITIDWMIVGYENLPAPTPAISDKVICAGSTVDLDATDCHAESYLWSTGETTAEITVSSAGTYWVDATNFGGTTRDTVIVTETALPVAGFVASDNGLDVDFTNGSTNATSYSWDFGGDGTSIATNPSHTFTSASSYNVCLTATSTCGTDTDCENITVSAPAGPEISVEQGATLIANGGSYDFGNVNTGSSVPVVFTVRNTGTATLNISLIGIVGDAAYSNSSGFFTVAAGGSETMTITFAPTSTGVATTTFSIDSDDADESSYVVNITGNGTTTTGLSGSEHENIIISPNPFNNTFSIDGNDSKSWIITDSFGKEVLVGEGNEVNMTNFSSGIYFIQLNNGTVTKRVVKL